MKGILDTLIQITSLSVLKPTQKMILLVNVDKEKYASYVIHSIRKMSSYKTTTREQVSYIAITFKEVFLILFHNLFHRKVSNCGKHGD